MSKVEIAGLDPTAPVLECRNVSLSYFTRAGEIPAVVDFNMTVMPGEAVGLVGESGCGKSTVALGVMNYMGSTGKVVSGQILYKGRDILTMTAEETRQIRGSEIAMVYQEPMASLNPSMKVDNQLMEVPLLHEDVTREEARQRARDILDAVRLPDPDRIMNSYPHQLSGGQQQRVVIAMALLSKPSLLLLDEPTTALDVTVEASIVDLVRDLAAEFGTSMVYISHNLGLILDTCDRINVMYSGEAVEFGTVDEVFNKMRHPYTQGLFRSIPLPGADKNASPLVPIRGQLPLPHERPRGCNFQDRCDHFVAGVCDKAEIDMHPVGGQPGHLSRCLRFNEIDWAAPPKIEDSAAASEPGDVVLDVTNLKKYYEVAANAFLGAGERRTVKANEEVDLIARQSETVAIVGESGCGKSTLAKVLLGLETATAGEAQLNGTVISNTPVQSRGPETLGSVQMVFQNPFDTLNPSQSVGAQIVRALEKFGIGESDAAREARMLELLDLVKLPRDFAKRMPRQLSGGQKQRIGIARAFAGTPAVVVADEPVSALDVSVQAAVSQLLMDIQSEHKTTLLFISHDLSIVRYLSDRVVVMYLGHVVEQGTTEQVFSPPYHPYTEALLSAVPIADTRVKKKRIILDGDIPSALNPPSGCPFQTRCPRKAMVEGDLCETTLPPMRTLADGHQVKCHLAQSILDEMEAVIQIDALDSLETGAEVGRSAAPAPSARSKREKPAIGSA